MEPKDRLMLRHLFPALGLLSLVATVASAQTVSLTLQDGRVTLRAENASVRQILAEWERQGQVKIAGADRITGGAPLTLTLADIPERQALDIVLRGLPGYLVIDRATPVATLSRYDRLVLMPRTTTPVSAVAGGAVPGARPTPAQVYSPPPTPDADALAVAAPDRDDAVHLETALREHLADGLCALRIAGKAVVRGMDGDAEALRIASFREKLPGALHIGRNGLQIGVGTAEAERGCGARREAAASHGHRVADVCPNDLERIALD